MTYLKSFEFPDSAGFHVVAGRSDGLQRLMVVSGRLPAGNGGGSVHAHLGDEVLRIISGEIIVRVGDERRLCAAGDVAVVPPNVLHGFQVVQDTLMEVVADYDIGLCSPSVNPTGAGGWWRCTEPTFPGVLRRRARVSTPPMRRSRRSSGRSTSRCEVQRISCVLWNRLQQTSSTRQSTLPATQCRSKQRQWLRYWLAWHRGPACRGAHG